MAKFVTAGRRVRVWRPRRLIISSLGNGPLSKESISAEGVSHDRFELVQVVRRTTREMNRAFSALIWRGS
jgi:hypothetical protein